MAPRGRQVPRALHGRPLLKRKQAEAMRQAVREIDALIILAATPDLFETVAFPQRVRERTVAAMWSASHAKQSQMVRSHAAAPVAVAAAALGQPGGRGHGRRRGAPGSGEDRTQHARARRQADNMWHEDTRQLVPPVRHTLREVLPVSTLRRVSLVAAISQWRLVVSQRSRHIRMLARALGACRARVFHEWWRVAASLHKERRAVQVAAAGEAASAASAAAVQRVARGGSWPRLLGEAQHVRRKMRDLQRWRHLETRAVIGAWSVLAYRGRVLRQRPWVVKHSLVLRRCLYTWEQSVVDNDLGEAGMVAVASAAPFVQRLVRPTQKII
eukprot:COSAG02_NODE_635_length_19251_cov_32.350982_12_plen_328_part_00